MQKTLNTTHYDLNGLSRINILIGKNGCGKSTILREISDIQLSDGVIHYISPQRGGVLMSEAGIEQNMSFEFKNVGDEITKLVPVFGAHPLTRIYNEFLIFLVEGDDDVRIWQQVVRSAEGTIKINPIACGSVDEIRNYECVANEIMASIYNSSARCYSLRDGDNNCESTLSDDNQVIRLKLACYGPENLLLTNEVLKFCKTDWEKIKKEIENWLINHAGKTDRNDYKELNNFKNDGFDRQGFKIKDSRNTLVGFMDTAKPWEVIVGQTIANLCKSSALAYIIEEGAISNFLGEKLINTINTDFLRK